MNRFLLTRRHVFAAAAAATSLLGLAAAASAQAPAGQKKEAKVHRLAIHVDDNDAAKMNLALNNAANVTEYYTGKGEQVEIEIVVYGPGLHMLREDTVPPAIKSRLKSFRESFPEIVFAACENTRTAMAKAEGKQPGDIPLVEYAKSVTAGVVRLIELQEEGWAYVKP